MDRAVPIEHLHTLYAYSPGTGAILNRLSRGPAIAGMEAGTIRYDGYRVIKVAFSGKRIQIMAHVIAFAMHHGRWPVADVDHEDTVRTNNTIRNLREGTRSQNLANRKKLGSLPKGVTFDSRRKAKPYRAQISVQSKNIYLGHFDDPESAHQAYWREATKVHGEFARAS